MVFMGLLAIFFVIIVKIIIAIIPMKIAYGIHDTISIAKSNIINSFLFTFLSGHTVLLIIYIYWLYTIFLNISMVLLYKNENAIIK